MTNIKDLWNLVIQYGYIVRSNKLDGLESWKKLKDIITEIGSNKKYKWPVDMKPNYNILKNLSSSLLENFEDDKLNNTKWEKEHFYIQHFRITAKNDNPKMSRILQVAYNTGQLMAERAIDPTFYEDLNNNLIGLLYVNKRINNILNDSLYLLTDTIYDPINYILNYNLYIYGDTVYSNYKQDDYFNYYPKYENIDKLYNKINNLLHNLDTSTKYKEITLDYNAINTKYI